MLTIYVKTYDLVAVSRELCGGNGPDIVFDCAVSFKKRPRNEIEVLNVSREWLRVSRRRAMRSGPAEQ